MVVSFVLEHQQPVLINTVNIDFDLYRTSIDLFTLVKIFQQTGFFQLLSAEASKIHKGDGLVCSACVEVFSGIYIIGKGSCDIIGLNRNIVNDGRECGVTTVIRPVGIDHSDLGYGRIALFLLLEILLAELDIIKIHSKTQICKHSFEIIL